MLLASTGGEGALREGKGSGPSAGRRRQVAVAGHQGDEDRARAGLADGEPAVRATALGALARMSRLTRADLAGGLADLEPRVRRRAVELAARFPEPDLVTALADPDPGVVEAAAWALGERGSGSGLAPLAGTALDHPDPLCREAAVAALGAIGAPESLGAILAALNDRPAVRRRAVLALAPFEGPEVEAALRRAASDRDWQVRQAAEDLLLDDPRAGGPGPAPRAPAATPAESPGGNPGCSSGGNPG